jgi:predicted ATPase/signal transduction histidine kinase/tRNA A-37 threonylcarbamoyl transferase component Bud32
MFLEENTKLKVSGYCITEKIYLGYKTIVLKAIREEDNKPVIIKMMRNEYPSPMELNQFRHQYIIAKNLNIPGIVKAYSLENHARGYVLIMEDFGGIALKEEMTQWKAQQAQKNPAFLSYFFNIAIEIIKILGGLHKKRIVHKDIKPANIIIHPDTLDIKITDFSIASILPKEMSTMVNATVLEGTIAYISPEQTGRMNRYVDCRSDLYSLGVTFFELLTGELPFNITDSSELIHSHVAKKPPLAHSVNPKIPEVLSKIIDKLMAKNPEDRYQSTRGLIYDLEECKKQWLDNGEISKFRIAQQDASDFFIIPDTLYGRAHDTKELIESYQRVAEGSIEVCLVQGPLGIGKTALVNNFQKSLIRKSGYFIQCQFEEAQKNVPFAGFSKALKELVGQILSETDYQIGKWKNKILRALDDQAQIIIDIVPDLELIIGPQPGVEKLSGIEANNRFNLLFQRFIQLFIHKDHPLIIFLDDLQWADAGSLELMKLVVTATKIVRNTSTNISNDTNEDNGLQDSLLLIISSRNNKLSFRHPLKSAIRKLNKTGVKINSIILENLDQAELSNLIQNLLNSSDPQTISLSQMTFVKAQGNPLLSLQFVKTLHSEELITFNYIRNQWECNMTLVREFALTKDVIKFMLNQMEELPFYTQNLLSHAAFLGHQFDLPTLSIACEQSALETSQDLWPSLIEGVILSQSHLDPMYRIAGKTPFEIVEGENYTPVTTSKYQPSIYKFLHKKIKLSSYTQIPKEYRQSRHLKIGRLLLSQIPQCDRKLRISDIVYQFNRALPLITSHKEKTELAEMNLIAGQQALESINYKDAVKYLTIGIKLLSTNCWQARYELALDLHQTAAQAAYLIGEFKLSQKFVDIVLNQAQTIFDKVKVIEVKIQLNGAEGKALDAVIFALEYLKLLGVDLPISPSEFDVQQELELTAANLAGREIEDLINLPEMTEKRTLALMSVLSCVITLAYQSTPNLFLLIVFRLVNLSLDYGNAPLSPFAYVAYGLLVSGYIGNIDLGYKFGQLALQMVEKSDNQKVKVKVIQTFNGGIKHCKCHINETLLPLQETSNLALKIEDLEFAGLSMNIYCNYSYFIGQELFYLQEKIEKIGNNLKDINQKRFIVWNEIYHTSISILRNKDFSQWENKFNPIIETVTLNTKHDYSGLCYVHIFKLQLSYIFNDYYQALENSIEGEKYLQAVFGQIVVAQLYFYDSLARTALYKSHQESQQKEFLDKIISNQEKIKFWAEHAPMNYLHKYYIVEGELHRIKGEYHQGMDSFEQAISLAKKHQYLHEEALAYELAAKLYIEFDRENIGKVYLADAYYAYMRWGAKAKLEDLRKRYPVLLNPIPREEENLNNFDPAIISSNLPITISSINEKSISNSTHNSYPFDVIAILKASQAFSGALDIEQVLSTLISVVMENAGASKCAFILKNDDTLQVVVKGITSSISSTSSVNIDFPSIPLESSRDVPVNIINYVKRTSKILVIDDAREDLKISKDAYIVRNQVKSIVCMPIHNQGKLLGILYLENNLATKVFTSNRLEILKFLTIQAAISLENALLYENIAKAHQSLEDYSHHLEDRVTERTQELNNINKDLKQALIDLQNTQAQLIQSEKMSSLGQMVAGVAHEINNPINFIHGNISHINKNIQDLLELINVYQQEYPNPSPSVMKKAEDIDLHFLMEDLPKLLESVNVGSCRIRNIVLGLRNFSRLDEAEMKAVNIHEGIDSTLMILEHRLNTKPEQRRITVIKNYGELPLVNCYAGQLNQVFMNIISNAIDALQESIDSNHNSLNNSNQITNGEKIIRNPQIQITTEIEDSNTILIKVRDNACGMPIYVQNKIFDPFFTTKPVGSGTGLGLAISYQIVVEKHKGKLICNSTQEEGTEFIIEIPV